MATPIQFPDAFNGMYQDLPRDRLPKGKAWNMVDYIPRVLGAPATQRGGWAVNRVYGSASGTVFVSSTSTQAIACVSTTAGMRVLSVDQANQIVNITNSLQSPPANLGTCNTPVQAPVALQQNVYFPSLGGATIYNSNSGSVTSLTASPSAPYATTYSNRVAAGGATAQPQRVYFSGIGDATTWNTTVSYIDVSGRIVGFAALPGALLVFTPDHCARIRGANPPPQTDMTVDDPVFQYGCIDARSIAVQGQNACFANSQGVFLTNGTTTPVDLTLACGIKQYWQALLVNWSSTWILAGGWLGNFYVLTLTDGSTFKDGFVFDPHANSVFRISNVKATMFASVLAPDSNAHISKIPDLWFGLPDSKNIGGLFSLFTPSATYKNDGDGTAVTPVLETPFYEAKNSSSSQRWKDAYLDYDLRDAASDDPTYTLGYVTSPESTSYTNVAQGTLAKTTTRKFARRQIHAHSRGLGFKLTRTNAASSAKIYAIAATVSNREGSRLDSLV